MIYLITAVGVGYGCFRGFLFAILNLTDSIVSRDNKPLSLLVAIITILGFSGFLWIGNKIDKSSTFFQLTFTIIFLSMFLSLPVSQAISSVTNNISNNNATQKFDKYMYRLNEVIKKSDITPFELDSNQSHFFSINTGDTALVFNKQNQETLLREEVDNIISFIPSTDREIIRLYLNYGKKTESKNREFNMEIFLNKNKMPYYCTSNDFPNSLCSNYDNY